MSRNRLNLGAHHTYRSSVDATTVNSFATASFRFGHSEISPSTRPTDRWVTLVSPCPSSLLQLLSLLPSCYFLHWCFCWCCCHFCWWCYRYHCHRCLVESQDNGRANNGVGGSLYLLATICRSSNLFSYIRLLESTPCWFMTFVRFDFALGR